MIKVGNLALCGTLILTDPRDASPINSNVFRWGPSIERAFEQAERVDRSEKLADFGDYSYQDTAITHPFDEREDRDHTMNIWSQAYSKAREKGDEKGDEGSAEKYSGNTASAYKNDRPPSFDENGPGII